MQVCGGRLALNARRQSAGGLFFLESAIVAIVVKDMNRRIEFAEHIHDPAVRVKYKMARASLFL